MNQPADKSLLISYLKLSIQTSKKSPREVYHILELSLPNLMPLTEDELDALELDNYIHKEAYADALLKMESILEKSPDFPSVSEVYSR